MHKKGVGVPDHNKNNYRALAGELTEHKNATDCETMADQRCEDPESSERTSDRKRCLSKSTARFPLSAFSIPDDVQKWMDKEAKTKSLIMSGTGGLGKTEFAKAMLSQGEYLFVDSLDTLKSCVFSKNEGLVLDDARLDQYNINDAKSFLNVIRSWTLTMCWHTLPE